MIIVKLIGGLGNQLFQYACGRNLALKNDAELKLDISGFEKYTKRRYELDTFNIVENIANKDDTKGLKWIKGRQILSHQTPILSKFIPSERRRGLRYVSETNLSFDPSIMNLKGDNYLDGYWQSEKYFVEISSMIRKEFSLKDEPDEDNWNTLSKIKDSNSVSLHIRRGDYVLDPKITEVHGVLGEDYYSKALDIISERVSDPHIFVFSDDIQWVKDNLQYDSLIHFIDSNGPDKGYQDLRLMCNCKHHIIANSSFSWWGAWLSDYNDKLVIAPRRWFADEKMNNVQTIVPDDWCRL